VVGTWRWWVLGTCLLLSAVAVLSISRGVIATSVGSILLGVATRSVFLGLFACGIVLALTVSVLRKLLPPSLEPTWEPPDEMASFELSPEAKHHWERSYRLFSDLLRLDPSWSWARRYAEEARAYRLGIDPISQAVAAASKAQREAQVEERRQEYEAKRKAREQAKKKEAKGAGAEDDE